MKDKSGIFKLAAIFVIMAFIAIGCTATLSQKRAVLGIADWYVVNYALLSAEFQAAADAKNYEHGEWLWVNVGKPMNLLKYGILGLDAVGENNTENMVVAANGILKWAEVDWDSTKLVMAIQTKDYDAIQVELLSLKNFIIARWLTSKEDK